VLVAPAFAREGSDVAISYLSEQKDAGWRRFVARSRASVGTPVECHKGDHGTRIHKLLMRCKITSNWHSRDEPEDYGT
jgi:hypothetical protein